MSGKEGREALRSQFQLLQNPDFPIQESLSILAEEGQHHNDDDDDFFSQNWSNDRNMKPSSCHPPGLAALSHFFFLDDEFVIPARRKMNIALKVIILLF